MNSSSTELPCALVVSTLFIAITSIISFAAFVGNCLVTLTFLKAPNLRTSTNYYIVNMAVSDVLCSCFNWLLYVTEGMLTSRVLITGPSASALCKLGIYSRSVSQVVSVLSLVLIAVDRYIAIVFPFKATIFDQGKVRLSLSLFTWIVPLVFGCPYVLYAKVNKEDDHTFCRVLWDQKSSPAIFHAVGFVVFYCIPLLVIIILYYRIVKALRNRPNAQEKMSGPVNNNRQRQQQKITKILIAIVIAFFVCWTPLCVYLALKMFHPNLFVKDECKSVSSLFFYVFPSLSTAVNPVILFLFSSNYRQAFANLCPHMHCNCFIQFRNKRIAPSPSHVIAVQVTAFHLDEKLL